MTTTTTTTTTTHTPPTILTRQPLKTLYILTAILLEAFVRLPLSALLYLLLPSLTRPDPGWTWRQAMGVRLLRAIVHHMAAVEARVALSLAPGAEGDRFEVMEPAESSAYRGPLRADDDDGDDDGDGDKPRPARIGGTWYPERYHPAPATIDDDDNNNEKAIVLHFHGGAFVLGDGRERDCGPLARTMLSTCSATISHVFCPQYRLASTAPFPAALQDALTAYLHLRRRLRVPARRIVLSGDSAGGNIVNGLLRYLGTYHDGAEETPPAACAWLWSPWTSPALALVPGRTARSPNRRSDYITERFGAWGYRTYAGRRRDQGLVDDDGWITAVAANPFPSPAPVWVQTGARELLLHDNVEFFEGLRRLNEEKNRAGGVVGQPCELEIVPHAPHDIALFGHVLGFSREYAEALKKAEAFFQRVRK